MSSQSLRLSRREQALKNVAAEYSTQPPDDVLVQLLLHKGRYLGYTPPRCIRLLKAGMPFEFLAYCAENRLPYKSIKRIEVTQPRDVLTWLGNFLVELKEYHLTNEQVNNLQEVLRGSLQQQDQPAHSTSAQE